MFNIIFVIIIVVLVVYALKRAGVGGKGTEEIIAEGDRFLAENGEREEVTQTASGLQYEVIYEGAGERHPEASERVLVHYHGTLIDGSVFDSSVDRGEPIRFGLNQVISGWTEGVQLMTEGGKYRFFIPASLGYGNRKAGSIPGGSVLIFEVELIEIG
jgi:peptidylprolyl isomerase